MNRQPIEPSVSLHPVTRKRYEQAVKRGYLVYKSSERSSPLRRVFWDWCVRYARPQVTVVTTPKKAIVDMDLISIDRDERRFQTDTPEWRFYVWDLKQTVETYMPGYYQRAHFGPGFYTLVRGVPHAQAESLAQALLAVYVKHYDADDK